MMTVMMMTIDNGEREKTLYHKMMMMMLLKEVDDDDNDHDDDDYDKDDNDDDDESSLTTMTALVTISIMMMMAMTMTMMEQTCMEELPLLPFVSTTRFGWTGVEPTRVPLITMIMMMMMKRMGRMMMRRRNTDNVLQTSECMDMGRNEDRIGALGEVSEKRQRQRKAVKGHKPIPQ